jgi:ribosomal protein L29
MKVADIRKMETKKLAGDVVKLREEISELRRRVSMGETQNVRAIRNKRKDLARMLTVMSEQLQKEAR